VLNGKIFAMRSVIVAPKRIVWRKIESGEPTQRVTTCAAFSMPFGSDMVAVYTDDMKLVGNVHLIAGNSAVLKTLFKMLESEGYSVQRNPDIFVREYSAFGVDDARELIQRTSSRAVGSLRRVFIVVTPSMTTESQNALLKTLEEPSGDALLFFVVPSPQTLLPTIRSRAQILSIQPDTKQMHIDPQTFLEASVQKRLDMLKPLLEKDDEDKRDSGHVFSFLEALEHNLGSNVKKNTEQLKAVYRARKYLNDKGSLVKTLLEHVALLAE
jgi:hypothetical protein